jgi:uncharacterized membrane protein YeaQ/YmgE (transglycosylase-associated protein family)
MFSRSLYQGHVETNNVLVWPEEAAYHAQVLQRDALRVQLAEPISRTGLRDENIVPDIVNLVIWLVAGVAGGNAAGELLKGDYDLGPGNTVAGAIGGVVGTFILQGLIPNLRGIDYGPIIGQLIVAAASGAALTVIAAAVQIRRRQRRR